MLERISGIRHAGKSSQTAISKSIYDIHNISAKELAALTLAMYKKGEITLAERLPFVPLDTRRLSEHTGTDVHAKYYSRVWEHPNRKRDVMMEFSAILREQIRDGDNQINISATKKAITLLERLEKTPSFKRVLASEY